jgi:hypothetical protein
MADDPVDVLEDILKRNGCADVDLRDNEVDRYFLFDQISDPRDLDLAWEQFPFHQQIRSRADRVNAVSDIIPGWGYRTPKESNRCSDDDLIKYARDCFTAIQAMILREDYNHEVLTFLEAPYEIIVDDDQAAAPPEASDNSLFSALYEGISEFTARHYSFDIPLYEILYDWAIYLTKCDEVALYVLWPLLDGVAEIDPDTPVPGFELWRYGCRIRYWIKDNDFQSGVVHVQPPWRCANAI